MPSPNNHFTRRDGTLKRGQSASKGVVEPPASPQFSPPAPAAGLTPAQQSVATRAGWIAALGSLLVFVLVLANRELDHHVPHQAAAEGLFALAGLLALAILAYVWTILGPIQARGLFWAVSPVAFLGMMPAWFIATDYGKEVHRYNANQGYLFAVAMYVGAVLFYGIAVAVSHAKHPRTALGFALAYGVGATGGVLLTSVVMVSSFSARMKEAADANRTPLDIVVDMLIILMLGAYVVRKKDNR